MQAIHIDDHVYNVRRDGLLDAGSSGGLWPQRLSRRDVARRSCGRPARSVRRLRSKEAPRWLVHRRIDRPGLIVPGAIRAANSAKV